MSQYPIRSQQDLVDAVNYLLSGPSGTGQVFNGVSTFTPVYIRPTSKDLPPFSVDINSTINNDWWFETTISNAVVNVDGTLVEFTFSGAFTDAPLQYGDQFELVSVTPTEFNQIYTVRSCTTTTVTVKPADNSIFDPIPTYVSGGSIFRSVPENYINTVVATDCGAQVLVNGGNDRVFITAQLNLDFEAEDALVTGAEFDLVVQVNRYRGRVNNNLVSSSLNYNPLNYFTWVYDTTVSQRVYNYTMTAATEQFSLESIFTQLFDGPAIDLDYYWYRLEIAFVTRPTYLPEYGSRPGGLPDNKAFTLSGTAPVSTWGTPQTFTGIIPTAVTGSGSGGVVDVFYNASATTPDYNSYDQVSTTTAGSGYQVGDILVISGADIGGATPDNDMTVVVNAVDYAGTALPKTFTAGLRSLTAQVVKQ
jgi:hypothetical protein